MNDGILLTKDATIGLAYLLDEKIDAISSSGVLRLKTKGTINRNYLTLVLNSLFVKSQIERDRSGSVIAHWKPEQIKQTLIPIIGKEKQDKISKIIDKSFILRKKSFSILEEAKKEIEKWVESQ